MSLYDIGVSLICWYFEKTKISFPKSKKCNCYTHMQNVDLLQQIIYPRKSNNQVQSKIRKPKLLLKLIYYKVKIKDIKWRRRNERKRQTAHISRLFETNKNIYKKY